MAKTFSTVFKFVRLTFPGALSTVLAEGHVDSIKAGNQFQASSVVRSRKQLGSTQLRSSKNDSI